MGRETDVQRLLEALEAANGRVVQRVVAGPQGIGKSRLVREFLSRARAKHGHLRVFRGSAREGDASFAVLARVLRARFGVVEGMDAEAQKAQIRTQVALVHRDRKVGDVCFFLGRFLGLEFQESPLTHAVRYEEVGAFAMQRAVLRHFLDEEARRDAARGPLVLVFDDLHFADDDTLALLEGLGARGDAPTLHLLVGRGEFLARAPAYRRPEMKPTLLELRPLGEDESKSVVNQLLAPCGAALGLSDLVDASTTMAQGNPGLLENMVRLFFEMGVLEVEDEFAEVDSWKVHLDRLKSVKVPVTVEDAVLARILALSEEERRVLEPAATMGGVFWLGAVRSVVQATAGEATEAKLREVLDELIERDYVLRMPDSTFFGDEEYVFKHNLEREKLAALVPSETKRGFHRLLATYLQLRDATSPHDDHFAMLARHLEAAARPALAANAFYDAAARAAQQFASVKSTEYLVRARGLLESRAAGDTRAFAPAIENARLLLDVLALLGDMHERQGNHDDAESAFAAALEIAERFSSWTRAAAAHGRLGRLKCEGGSLPQAEEHLARSLALWERAGSEGGVARAHDDLARIYWLTGRRLRAFEAAEHALAMRRRLGDARGVAASLCNVGLLRQDGGEPRLAYDAFQEALHTRRQLGDTVGMAAVLRNLATLALDQRELPRAADYLGEAMNLSREAGDRRLLAECMVDLGDVTARAGDTHGAAGHVERAAVMLEEMGDRRALLRAVRALADIWLKKGEPKRAYGEWLRALEIATELGSALEIGVTRRALAGYFAGSGTQDERDIAEACAQYTEAVRSFERGEHAAELAATARAFYEYTERNRGRVPSSAAALAQEYAKKT